MHCARNMKCILMCNIGTIFGGWNYCTFAEDYKIINELTTAIYVIIFPVRDYTDHKYIFWGSQKF